MKLVLKLPAKPTHRLPRMPSHHLLPAVHGLPPPSWLAAVLRGLAHRLQRAGHAVQRRQQARWQRQQLRLADEMSLGLLRDIGAPECMLARAERRRAGARPSPDRTDW